MIATLTQIGNSQGIRIPQHILSKISLTNQVELKIEGKNLVLMPISDSEKRKDWDKAFDSESKNEDISSFKDIDHSWDREEWQW